jgi:two-component system alkaline phosphatase synthesis response regulator PhoP
MTARNVLVVDDEQDIVDIVKYNLHKEGYTVRTARNGREALSEVDKKIPDLIILDVMMPELDGFQVLKQLKQSPAKTDIPVIFLTAKGADIDEVLGFELGADDYIIKPISIPKLVARVKNVLRKHDQRQKSATELISLGAIEIIPSQHVVRVEGNEVFFPKKEFEVLQYLAGHAENVVTREVLLDAVWGTDVRVVDRTVDVHIRKIREKLGKFADYIETIKGIGYRMRE